MEDQIYITIAKVLHGEASDAERRELDAWIAADKANANIFEEMKATWTEADKLFDAPEFNAAPAWQKVSARTVSATIGQTRTETAPKQTGRTIAFPSWIKYSSAVAAILIIALFIWNPFNSGEMRVLASAGNQRIELPDHSVITLRQGSTLSYPKRFAAAERRVSLEGEAFFEVTRNEQQPFVIDAQAVDVRVLGTTFNVRCEDNVADVAVSTGRVQVTSRKDARQAVILTAGRAAHYQAGTLSEGIAYGSEASWKNGELAFNNEPLSKVAAAIASAKDTAVSLDASLTTVQQEQAVNVTFRNQSLEDMLTELCLITRTRWEKRNGAYVILPK
jgi:ferric-dicitrate binding protein FerR (iron transport regulator)